MSKKIKIAVVDQYLFRKGLISLLEAYEELKIIADAANSKELLSLLKKAQPHIVLLDVHMPQLNGLETTITLKKTYPDIKIIVLTTHSDEALIFDLIKKGINSFLLKDKSIEHIVEAIRSVYEKGFYYTEEMTLAMVKGLKNNIRVKHSLETSSLTEREMEILQLICKQYSLKDIAELLMLSPRTVETHKENILIKTGSKNTVGIALYAVENNLIN